MESDRFDDVDFRMIEEPGPPPRRRHRGLAVLGGLFVAGALALGASALAAPDEPVAPAAKPASFDSSSHWRHHGCHHGRSQRDRGQDSTLKY